MRTEMPHAEFAVSRKRESYGKIRLRECERRQTLFAAWIPRTGLHKKDTLCYLNVRNLPFPINGRPSAKVKDTLKIRCLFFGSPMRNRTADSAVRGQRLNRLTMRPSDLFKLSYFKVSYVMITYFFYYCNCLPAFQGKNKIIF